MFRTLRFYHSFFKFLSTPSARRATIPQTHLMVKRCYFYPRPPRGGRLFIFELLPAYFNFYPRPPRGGRPGIHGVFSTSPIFLSTPSARRATQLQSRALQKILYFYPRPPRGGRLRPTLRIRQTTCISIHALREEGDLRYFVAGEYGEHFYPRPPRGGRRD